MYLRGMPMREMTSQLKEKARSAAESVVTMFGFFVLRLCSLTPVLGDDRGEIASWVVVTALVVVAAIAIVAIVVSKLTATANNIQTP